jgi:hypothetical protein
MATSLDILLIADKSGLYAFNGSYGPIAVTWAIEKFWNNIDPDEIRRLQVVVNVKRRKVYVALTTATGSVLQDKILVGDWKYGMEPENLIWSVWKSHLQGIDSMFTSIDITGEATPTLYVGSFSRDTIYQSSGVTDDGDGLEFDLQFSPTRFDSDSEIYQYTAAKFKGYSTTGAFILRISYFDAIIPAILEQRDVTIGIFNFWYRQLFNFFSGMACLRFSNPDPVRISEKFVLTKAIAYGGIEQNDIER